MINVRSYSKRKKSRVNIILSIINGEDSELKDQPKRDIEVWLGGHNNWRSYSAQEYFKDPYISSKLHSAFSYLPARCFSNSYLIKAYLRGGGLESQADALKLAISRALLQYYPEMKNPLRKANLLTQDRRVKERKKIGKYKARRSPQFTKR